MCVIFAYSALVVLTFTLGILLLGLCGVLLMIRWGFQKASTQFQRPAAERPLVVYQIYRTVGPISGPETRYECHTLIERRFATEASSGVEDGPGARPQPAPQLQ
jgi:hypothetical protein